jgi:hypothetical protein
MKLELTTEQVNQILNALAQQPYIQVNELINSIQQQGNTQIQNEQAPIERVSEKLANEARESVIND